MLKKLLSTLFLIGAFFLTSHAYITAQAEAADAYVGVGYKNGYKCDVYVMTETIHVDKATVIKVDVDACRARIKFVADGRLISNEKFNYVHMYKPVRSWLLEVNDGGLHKVNEGSIEYTVLKYILDSNNLSQYLK